MKDRKELKKLGKKRDYIYIYTGCGRKNTPIWVGHSFGWGSVQQWGLRRRTAVHVPFSVYTMVWQGEHRAFIVEEFIKTDGSPVATQRAFRIRFALGRREAVPDKKTIYRWVSNCRQTGQTLEALKEAIQQEVAAITPEMVLNGQLPRGYISVSIFKAAT